MDKGKAYATLSDLIFKGFLSTEVDLNGKRFVFKTVNEREYDLVKLYAGDSKRFDYNSRFNSYFMVFSLFLADGGLVLSDRDRKISELYGLFFQIPNYVFKHILHELNGLRVNAYNCLEYLEGFSYTHKSRRLWNMMGGEVPCKESFTGIPGTYNLGLNAHQENWIVINRMLDTEEKYNSNFSLALMVASASNPKGAKKIGNQHDVRTSSAEERRIQVAKDGKRDARIWSAEGWAAPVDTVESLVEELERQMKGIKDKHDLFVEEYIQKMKDTAKKKADDAKKRLEEIRKQRGEDLPAITSTQRILTDKETEELMRRSPKTLVSAISEDAVSAEDKDRFIKKVGTRVLTARK